MSFLYHFAMLLKYRRVILFVTAFFISFLLFGNESSPFEIVPKRDYSIIGASFFIGVMPQIFGEEISTKTNRTDYKKSNINALDRALMNGDCETCSSASDLLVISLPVAGMSYLGFLNYSNENTKNIFEDATLFAQVLTITGALGQTVRYSFKRPRPYVYNNKADDPRRYREDRLSFFSGHTASAFASATVFSEILERRFPNKDLLPLKIGFYSAAGLVAAGRVLSGEHFFSDVMTGAVIGSTIGYCVPSLHLKTKNKIEYSFVPLLNRKFSSVNVLVNF